MSAAAGGARGRVGLGGTTLFLVAAVVAVNAFGVWEIAAALRGLHEQRELALEQEARARARAVENRLAEITAELAFLAGSAPLRDDPARGADRAWRDEAGAALLLVLRGHARIAELTVIGAAGEPLVRAGRPRGVPGYWIPGPDAPDGSGEGRGAAWSRRFPAPAGRSVIAVVRPSAAVAPEPDASGEAVSLDCRLVAAGVAGAAGAAGAAGDVRTVVVPVDPGPWAAADGWTLTCAAGPDWRPSMLEPLVERQRAVIAVNAAAMALVAVLGVISYRQAVRRRASEARAAEEARVRELERQLFHAERLRTVGRLAAGVAHELNNPLEGMANYLRLAEESLERGEVAAARRQLGGVGQGVERAAGIVRRVLDHADPSTAPRRPVDAARALARAVEFVAGRKEFSAIRLECRPPEGDAVVLGSAVLLGQVFLNLTINACEAQPDGGEVVASCRAADGHVICEVADRGPGVRADRRDRIFEPFESTKRSAGLGLSICHSIVQQHGGELSFADREGGGAVFRVKLPAAPAGAERKGEVG